MSRPRPSARHSVRADDGVGGTTIYQLHTASRSTRIESSRQGALAAAQAGAWGLHPLGSKNPALSTRDQIYVRVLRDSLELGLGRAPRKHELRPLRRSASEAPPSRQRMETVLRDGEGGGGGGGGDNDDDDAAAAAAAARRRRRLARRARKAAAEHAVEEDHRCADLLGGLARQPHSATLQRDFRAHMAALRQSRSFPDLPVGRPAEVPRKARAHRLRSLAPSVREHLRPHDEAIDSAVERLDRTLTEEEREEAAKAEEAQRFLEQPAPAPAPVATNAPAPAALRPPPIRIAPRLEDAGAGGEETLFDRDLWPRTGDESPTPESSARVRFE